jgi:hypothetical protein
MDITLRKVREDTLEQQLVELSRDIKDIQKRIIEYRRLLSVAEPVEQARYRLQLEDQQQRLEDYKKMRDDLEQPRKVELQMLVSYKADNTSNVEHDIQALSFML